MQNHLSSLGDQKFVMVHCPPPPRQISRTLSRSRSRLQTEQLIWETPLPMMSASHQPKRQLGWKLLLLIDKVTMRLCSFSQETKLLRMLQRSLPKTQLRQPPKSLFILTRNETPSDASTIFTQNATP